MNQINAHKIGLVVGGTMAIWHAIWASMVLVGVAKAFMDWILGLHFMQFTYNILPFNILTALMLVLVTGIIGYLLGYVSGWLWNMAHKMSHGK